MAKYNGYECLACKKKFTEDDDVVVCPECGTPYHRECYLREGKCINDSLHVSGLSWMPPEPDGSDNENETVRCIRCGAENPSTNDVCDKCGTPLLKNNTADRPFNGAQNPYGGPFGADGSAGPRTDGMGRMIFDQDTEIEGIKLGDFARYVGTNPLGFLPTFIRFGKFGGKISMNIGAFFFTSVYFLYRKMKPWGIIFLILLALLGVPDMIFYLSSGVAGVTIDVGIDVKSKSFLMASEITSFVSLVVRILAAFFANYLYYQQAKRDISLIREEDVDDENTAKMKIAVKGGVSWQSVLAGFMVYSVINVGAVILMAKFL